MKIKFNSQDRKKILQDIRDTMGGRQLAEMVSFDMSAGSLTVTISKMGKSTLDFEESADGDGLVYDLRKEKIAFTHKPFKDEVTKKIMDVVTKAGGIVT